jgi:hypothetical protein
MSITRPWSTRYLFARVSNAIEAVIKDASTAAAAEQGLLQRFQAAYKQQMTSVIALTGAAMQPALNAGEAAARQQSPQQQLACVAVPARVGARAARQCHRLPCEQHKPRSPSTQRQHNTPQPPDPPTHTHTHTGLGDDAQGAYEKVVIRHIPRPSPRTIGVGDVVAFNSPLNPSSEHSVMVGAGGVRVRVVCCLCVWRRLHSSLHSSRSLRRPDTPPHTHPTRRSGAWQRWRAK